MCSFVNFSQQYNRFDIVGSLDLDYGLRGRMCLTCQQLEASLSFLAVFLLANTSYEVS